MKTPSKPMTLAWSDVDEFYVGHVQAGLSRTKMIGIKFSESYGKQAARNFSADLSGMEGALPNHFNKSAEEICEVLISYKQKWGQGA